MVMMDMMVMMSMVNGDGDDNDDDDCDGGDEGGLSGRARSLVINAHKLILVSQESCCRLHPDILTSLLLLSSSMSRSLSSPSSSSLAN